MTPIISGVLLPGALLVVMIGLGLSIDPAQKATFWHYRRVVAEMLAVQLLLLPLVALGMVVQAELTGPLAVGTMLIAASPGGPGASIFSRLFKADLHFSVALTTVNTFLAALTMPAVTALALYQFDMDVRFEIGPAVSAYVVVFGAIGLGLLVRKLLPERVAVLQQIVQVAGPTLMAGIALLVLIDAGLPASTTSWTVLAAVVILCVASFVVGFAIPRLAGTSDAVSSASGFVVGLSNVTLAMYVAVMVLKSVDAAAPAAIYGIAMFVFAMAWGVLLTRIIEPRRDGEPTASAS